MLSRRVAVVVTIVVVFAFIVATIAPAFAAAPGALPMHARLVGSSPADGSTVETAPQVVLEFSEVVNPSFVAVRVAGPGGAAADGAPVVEGREVTQALAADTPAGLHTVTYRVVSADGHPISGTVSFTTTAAAAGAGSTTPSATSATASAASSGTPTPEPTPTVTAPTSTGSTGGNDGSWLKLGLGVALLVALAVGASRLTRRTPSG